MAIYHPTRLLPSLLLIPLFLSLVDTAQLDFSVSEATVLDIQIAFSQNKLTSRQLVEHYIAAIHELNPIVNGVIEVNPDALRDADRADAERKTEMLCSSSWLHGVPVLLKDTIATKDGLNTTAGSFALLGSVVPRDAGVVARLRRAGAVILGKASLSEWAHFRSFGMPNGWSARGGQGRNPYVLSADPCGSSSGSAISVASNMVAVSLGTETDGSIICPASANSVVGIKPSVGLTSRSGVIPVSPRQDTVGPICRTVSDAVFVLDEIVGFDEEDEIASREASKFIPSGGYKQFLKHGGLKGKRLGVVRNPFFDSLNGSELVQAFEHHFETFRQNGAVVVDNLRITDVDTILNSTRSGEEIALVAEFKLALNAYLQWLVTSPVRSLAEVIAFNNKFLNLEMNAQYGQAVFLSAERTEGIGGEEKRALKNLERLSRDGFEKMMVENGLDAMVTPTHTASSVLAIGGFPGISVPAGFDSEGVPFGICFGGLRGSEPKLIEIAFAFEQATHIRKIPTFQL